MQKIRIQDNMSHYSIHSIPHAVLFEMSFAPPVLQCPDCTSLLETAIPSHDLPSMLPLPSYALHSKQKVLVYIEH